MPPIHDLAMNVARTTSSETEGAGEMIIIIRAPYAHLEKEMRKTFGEKAQVIIDRRNGERRSGEPHDGEERRHSDRRDQKEQLLEVVIRL